MSDAESIVRRWLTAYHTADWQTVWALLAPEALTVIGPQVLPRQAIPADRYVGVLESIAAVQGDRAVPHFALGPAETVPAADGPVVLVRAVEHHDGIACVLAFEVDAAGLIRAVTVDPPTAARTGILAAADLAQMPRPTTRQEAFRTPLDHAYARRHRGLGRPLRSLPEARFTCQGRGDCCQVGLWAIAVSDNQRLPLSRVAELSGRGAFRLQSPAGPPQVADPGAADERHLLAVGEWPACHQLTGPGTCSLHEALGWQPVAVCQLYPIHAIATPDGFDLTASFSCTTVCLNQGQRLQDQAMGLAERLWPFQFRLAEVSDRLPLVTGAEPTLPWPAYRDWERQLLDLLWQRDADGWPDLAQGSRRLAALAGNHLPKTGMDLEGVIARISGPGRPDGWLGGRAQAAWRAISGLPIAAADDGDLVARFLRAQLFRKPGLVDGDTGIAFPWGMTVIAAAMVRADARFRAWRGGRQRTRGDDVLEAVRAVETVILHGRLPAWLATLPGSPVESPMTWHLLRPGAVRP